MCTTKNIRNALVSAFDSFSVNAQLLLNHFQLTRIHTYKKMGRTHRLGDFVDVQKRKPFQIVVFSSSTYTIA